MPFAARPAREREYFGNFDPFGDFDQIFGAAKQNLKMIEMPIHYRARTFGETQIARFRDGWLLFEDGVVRLPQTEGDLTCRQSMSHHCERSEAIYSPRKGRMECFVALRCSQ